MNIKYWDDKCLKLWREAVHILWQEKCCYHSITGGRCEFIGDRQRLECHHLIPRTNKMWRHFPANSALLCPGAHDWFEQNPLLADEWFRENWPDSHKWATDNRHAQLSTPMWEIHYMERAKELQEAIKWLKAQ